ncbi:hypothetical protein LWI28_012924 [Acer negundo]|uniref:Uncharacterized protein n=1 Tax=Acer negundo TaxID=4023 RepID=A0AAD5IM91_ACENE|nr:hypothetical protein LWI28_012924 [Acer negundo]
MTVLSSLRQDEVDENARSSYFNLPALDVSVAFPQATPVSQFPPCASDYYQFDDLLTSEERAIRMKYWEKAEFPFHVVPKFAALHIAGGTIKMVKQMIDIHRIAIVEALNLLF